MPVPLSTLYEAFIIDYIHLSYTHLFMKTMIKILIITVYFYILYIY